MRINSISIAFVVSFCLLSAQQSLAQQSPTACDVPLVATRFDRKSRGAELVKDLSVNDFNVKLGGVPEALESASIDKGPKRMALILDASRSVPQEEWKLETRMAGRLVDHARPEDRFAIFVVGTDGLVSPLLPANESKQRLNELGSSRPVVTDASERTYDALLAAGSLFKPPEFGDILFLFGHPEDSGSEAKLDELVELILQDKLRFQALSFSDPLQRQVPAGFNPNKPLPARVTLPKLVEAIETSGYHFSFHAVDVLNLPGQTALLEAFLGDLYAGIAEPYRLRIAQERIQGPVKLEIRVKDLKSHRINVGDIHYPHTLYPCAVSTPSAN